MSCQTIYVMLSSFLSEEEKRIVAAHELGHITLHRSQLKMAPMSDNRLYNMINETEYQANLFAADLLIQDEDVAALSKQEDLDYFSFCSSLYATPELMSFKLYSLMKRGQKYNMPMDINSNFLAGSVKNFVALVKNGSFLVRITDMTILIEKEFIYGSSKRPNPTDYYRKQHYQCG